MKTRSNVARRRRTSPIVHSHRPWDDLTPTDQQNWRNAAKQADGFYRGYRLFTSDYNWRRKNSLSLPGTPNNDHQLMGIVMDNPGGSEQVELRRDDKDLIGPITVRISYAKDERTASGTYALKIIQTTYYFYGGENVVDTFEHVVPAGDVAWNTETIIIGISDKKYFHYKFVLTIQNYDAQVKIDNIVFSDKNGVFFRESFNTVRYLPWVPAYLYRKRDWFFTPSFGSPYFSWEYLG